jgi:ATP-dependent Lon protease
MNTHLLDPENYKDIQNFFAVYLHVSKIMFCPVSNKLHPLAIVTLVDRVKQVNIKLLSNECS